MESDILDAATALVSTSSGHRVGVHLQRPPQEQGALKRPRGVHAYEYAKYGYIKGSVFLARGRPRSLSVKCPRTRSRNRELNNNSGPSEPDEVNAKWGSALILIESCKDKELDDPLSQFSVSL